MKNKIKNLSREELQNVILDMAKILTSEQNNKLKKLIDGCATKTEKKPIVERMSQQYVDEKMSQIENWMKQIDEGELYLDTEEYEDYSSGYWDREWVTEYFDNQGIGDKIQYIIQFAKDCVDDGKYQNAANIYEWLWDMEVCTNSEYDSDSADLETLVENHIVKVQLENLQ